MKPLKLLAKFLLKDELMEKDIILKESQTMIEALSRERNNYKNQLNQVTREHHIILKHYKIDNIGADGIPPSYLPTNNSEQYLMKINELNAVYSNETFRELLAYLLNFHANMAATGKIKNAKGDMIDIPTEHVQHMVSAIKSVWELIVGARMKKKQLETSQDVNPYDIIDTADIEEGN